MSTRNALSLCDLSIACGELNIARENLTLYRNLRRDGAPCPARPVLGTILNGDEYAESCAERIEQARQSIRDAA
jgi:hypothetical protein